jgi:hypothetical protein
MNNEQHIHLITAYLEGSINPKQRAELNDLIDRGEIDIHELKEMELLYAQMGELPDAEPGNRLQERFYDMLDDEKAKSQTLFELPILSWKETLRAYLSPRRLTFALSIFVVGLLIGNWFTPFQNYEGELSALSTEVSQMREVMMMSLLENNSATERLKAVNISSEISSVDERITIALLKTLNSDPNVNVRIAAVEALLQHASAPNVREGLMASIARQQSPLVQAALADAMLVLQEQRSVKEFEELLNRDNLNPGVRDKLENVIAALS